MLGENIHLGHSLGLKRPGKTCVNFVAVGLGSMVVCLVVGAQRVEDLCKNPGVGSVVAKAYVRSLNVDVNMGIMNMIP